MHYTYLVTFVTLAVSLIILRYKEYNTNGVINMTNLNEAPSTNKKASKNALITPKLMNGLHCYLMEICHLDAKQSQGS